jgi:hypothetical protein
MEGKEKDDIKLRFGLSLKKIIDKNKAIGEKNKLSGIKDKNIINSFGRLESASGIPKATLIGIVQGKKNAASTTIAAILDAFSMTLTDFGIYYDSISDEEITSYEAELLKAKEERRKKLRKKKKSK